MRGLVFAAKAPGAVVTARAPTPTNRRYGYGSPWWVDAAIWLAGARAVVGAFAGIGTLVWQYGGIDIEWRLHRTQLRARLARGAGGRRRVGG